MWKLLKYEFRRARTSLLTVLGVIAVLEMYFLISLGVDHMEHVVIAAVLMMFATYGARCTFSSAAWQAMRVN